MLVPLQKMDTIFQAKAWASPVAVASSSGVSSQKSQESESEVSSGLLINFISKQLVATPNFTDFFISQIQPPAGRLKKTWHPS